MLHKPCFLNGMAQCFEVLSSLLSPPFFRAAQRLNIRKVSKSKVQTPLVCTTPHPKLAFKPWTLLSCESVFAESPAISCNRGAVGEVGLSAHHPPRHPFAVSSPNLPLRAPGGFLKPGLIQPHTFHPASSSQRGCGPLPGGLLAKHNFWPKLIEAHGWADHFFPVQMPKVLEH